MAIVSHEYALFLVRAGLPRPELTFSLGSFRRKLRHSFFLASFEVIHPIFVFGTLESEKEIPPCRPPSPSR